MSAQSSRDALRRMGEDAASLQDASMRADPHARLSKFEEAFAARRARQARRDWRKPVAIGIAALVPLAAAIALLGRPSPSLSFKVAQTNGQADGKVGAFLAAQEEMPLHFSDGTEVALDKRSSARVLSLDPNGAEMILEGGRLRASVKHTTASRWTFDVGPYVVHVTGTKFAVAWSPSAQRFTLDLEEGSVSVTGCALAPQAVSAGMSMRATCNDGVSAFVEGDIAGAPREAAERTEPAAPSAALLEDAGATNEVKGADDEAAHAAAISPTSRSAHASASPPKVEAAPSASGSDASELATSWRDLASRGLNREALEAVRPHFEEECAAADAKDVMLLAEIARYAGDPARARQALLTARKRFLGSSEATTAAFLLGRMAFDHGSYAESVPWFEATEQESHGGALGRDAAGRILEAWQKAGNGARARRAAGEYLERYPDGPHARLARSLLEP